MTRSTHCSLSSSHFENTLAVSVAPRISFASAFVSDCKTKRARRSFSGLTFPRWPRFSRPTGAAAPRSTLLEIVSPVLLLMYVFFSSPLPAERSGHRGLDACSSPALLPLPATPAGWASAQSCCCGTAWEIRTYISSIGTRHLRLVISNWPELFLRQLGWHLWTESQVRIGSDYLLLSVLMELWALNMKMLVNNSCKCVLVNGYWTSKLLHKDAMITRFENRFREEFDGDDTENIYIAKN